MEGRRILVAGHRGVAGAAVVRQLERESCDVLVGGRDKSELTRQVEVETSMGDPKPDVVVRATEKVGGILVNDASPARFICENLAIETNAIHAVKNSGVGKPLFLGSSCIYPR